MYLMQSLRAMQLEYAKVKLEVDSWLGMAGHPSDRGG
jgi:hypothetical protein